MWKGIVGIFPLALGAAAYGFAFGVVAGQLGFVWWGVALMSAAVHAGSSQIVAVERFGTDGLVAGAVLAGAALNLRYLGIVASLSEVLREASWPVRLFAIHVTGDENWALTMAERTRDPQVGHRFLIDRFRSTSCSASKGRERRSRPCIVRLASLTFDAQLGQATRNAFSASLIVFLVGTLALTAVVLATRTALPPLDTLLTAPRTVWLGGLIATLYIVAIVVLTPRLGVGLTVGLILVGQLFAGLRTRRVTRRVVPVPLSVGPGRSRPGRTRSGKSPVPARRSRRDA